MLREILDRYRLDRVGEVKSKNARIKESFAIQRAFDIFGATKSMLLAFKRDVSDGDALFAERFNHNLGLIWRHDFVFKSLKENDWARQSIGEVNRRAFDVKIATLWVRANQTVEIT